MSLENMYNDLYPFIIKDWKNTSLLVDRKNSDKSFSNVLREFIQYANQKSQYALSVDVLTLYQDKILKDNNQEICHSVFNNMIERYDEIANLDIESFTVSVLEHLSKHTNFISSLRPQGWEPFILDNRKNNWALASYDLETSKQRKTMFKGLVFDQEELAFYDKISLFITAKKFLESNVSPHLTLFKSVTEYVFNVNKKINTNLMTNNIDRLVKEGNNDKNVRQFFSPYVDKHDVKLDFEIIEENEKKKDDLNKILKKLSKVN